MKRLDIMGFTLVEVLVSLVVTTSMVLVVTNYMIRNIQQSTQATQRQTILVETEQSLDFVANDVRLSSDTDTTNRWPDLNGPGGNIYGWSSNASTLLLATAAQTKLGGIIFSDANNYITEKNNIIYFVKNGTLFKRILASSVSGNGTQTTCPAASATILCPADKELLHNVSLFNITYYDGQNQSVTPSNARSVELHITVTKSLYGQPLSADYTTRMVFRND